VTDHRPPRQDAALGGVDQLLACAAAGVAAARVAAAVIAPALLAGTALAYALRRAVVVDAIDADAPPGTLVRLEGDDLGRALTTGLTVHDVGLADPLGAARVSGAWPDELVVARAQPGSTAVGAELTAPLAACLDRLVDRVASELARWGAAPAPRV
jgi:hydrogenase maturation protease